MHVRITLHNIKQVDVYMFCFLESTLHCWVILYWQPKHLCIFEKHS